MPGVGEDAPAILPFRRQLGYRPFRTWGDVRMFHSPSRHAACSLALLISALLLPGCIVQEIREELATTNQSIVRVESGLDRANTAVNRVERRMDAVDTATHRLDDTNAKLAILESIDRSLLSIDASLKRLDDHLASLRTTITNIDSMIPMLKFSDDQAPTDARPAASPTPGAAPSPPGAPAAAPTAPAQSPPPQSPPQSPPAPAPTPPVPAPAPQP